MTIDDIQIIALPKVTDERGNLSFFEGEKTIPFEIKRTYWIYDVPGGERRGGHAYRTLKECIIALSGSFDIVLNDGKDIKKISLNRSYQAVYVPQGLWRHLENFSTNSLCLIVANAAYEETDYIRDFDDYLKLNINA